MIKLTKRQEEVLNFIRQYIQDHKYPPAIRDIAESFNISVRGAYDHIKALEKKEQIHCDLKRSRAIEIINDNTEDDSFIKVPLLGSVAAGIPLFAEENYDGSVKIPANVLSTGEHFALRVSGDSMQDAGILDGDLAVFHHQNTANNGEIILAKINDESVTLKRFYKEKNRVMLKAENAQYSPIYTQDIKILGKLKYLVRQYA